MSTSGASGFPSNGGQPVNVSAYRVGQIVHAVTAKYESKKTVPPPRYTLDTLLDDMLGAFKFAKNPKDREILRSVEGLGTSRTRIPMIESALKRQFFTSEKRGKKHEIKSTDMARKMMASIQPELKDVAQTAKWEIAFSMVESGEVTLAQVMDKAYVFVDHIVSYAKDMRGKIRFDAPTSSPQARNRH